MNTLKKILKNKWARLFILLALFVIYCVLMTVFVGTACPLELISGLPCPACGMTRANLLALKLDFPAAFEMHPLFFTAYIIFAGVILFTAKPDLQDKLPVKIVCIALIAAFIGVYIWRMIAIYPDSEPMTYNYNSLFGLIRKAFNF